ncbi:laccase [Embleya scabrispora]|uniref:Purine nucleoside phosphorylase n=1 Tax=Embleya scabrispora TaxID=159449 RepID=A0A1T3P2T7_9ACTN|nr:peptidoglycan editing factor PgeF [Embleya scabrispora]OPC83304.1 laccase [Embleya scabrispora]
MFTRRAASGGARIAFTDRWGGTGAAPYDELNLGDHVGDDPRAVAANRARTAEALGLSADRVVWMNQVHGNTVAVSTGPTAEPVPGTDAVVTATRGLALAVLVADCTPVLLADPHAGVIGAAHAGRPGLAAGVVPATIEAMRGLGADPARIRAWTGPAVCGACYEVPEAMCDEVSALVPAARARTRQDTPGLDIPAGVWAQLAAQGVVSGEKSHICTRESADHFSYRRDRVTGRIAGYVWLAED